MYRKYGTLIFIYCFLISNNLEAQWIETSGTSGNSITSFASTDSLLFSSTWGGGVFVSSDFGISWNFKNNGLPTPNVSRLIFNSGDLFAATDQGIFISSNNGEDWNLRNASLTVVEAFNFMDSNFLIGDWNNGFLISSDQGISWTAHNNGLTNFNVTTIYIVETNIYLVTYGGGIFLSTNSGLEWTSRNNGITNDTLSSFKHLNNYYFVSGWGGGVFRSTDQGENWAQSSTGLTSMKALSFASSNNTLLVTAYNGGVFSSDNFGESWTPINTGLTTLKVQQLFIYNGYVFVGTSGARIFRRNLSEITSINSGKRNELPADFKLYQNYPNPFNPSTKIKYHILKLSFVTLKIYDVLGNEIAVLFEDETSAGDYDIEFNAKKLPSGIYFYQFQAGKHIETKKMLLLK